jgi:hypothetical protein
MLDGKRYYAAFPDEDPVLQPRIAAVLRALGKVDKAFRKRTEPFWTEEIRADTASAPSLAPQ